MDLRLTAEDMTFREQVRTFLRETLIGDLKQVIVGHKNYKRLIIKWQRALYEKGWVAPGWPVEYGGTGWTLIRKYIFENECALAGAPEISPFGLKMLGPVLYNFGNEAQKARFLPDILRSNTWWCQGYSEPGAGSDLASLRMRAERHGDHYLVNGQKTWTTYAQYADWIFCLVRTDNEGRKQEGISLLLIDMASSGLDVKKIETIYGRHSLNEIFLENVRVPVENLIGEEGMGWRYAKFLLTHERTFIARVAQSKRALACLKKVAARVMSGDAPLIVDTLFQARLANVEIDLMALEYTELRGIARVAAGAPPGAESSILKLKGTEIQQAIDRLSVEVFGHYTHVSADREQSEDENAANIATKYLYGCAASIYGGSNEVQKNIIAKTILGL